MINLNNCMSIKCKNSNIQCPFKKKHGDYCGKHYNSKNIQRIDILLNINNINNNNINVNDNNNNNIDINKNIKKINQKKTQKLNIEDLKQIETNILNKKFNYYKVFDLRQIIKYHKIPINSKKSKKILCDNLYDYFNKNLFYQKNLNNIIIIQKYIRRNLIKNIATCVNKTDVATFDLLFDIPIYYFIKIKDNNNYYYGFDIRSLINIINDNCKNPYTFTLFSNNEIIKIHDKINYLKKNNINCSFTKDILDDNKMIELDMIRIFHEFDLLDNYTSHLWLKNLNLDKLKKLYKITEDIWNYRTNLPIDMKKKIVNNGVAFNISINKINKINDKFQLQKIILNEYDKFITYNSSRENKKLGVMLLLMGLVEINPNAANSLPHLIQNF